MDVEFQEDLAVALNVTPLLSRDAACRLAVAPEIWLDDSAANLEANAARTGVPSKAIRSARECARTAHHLARRERERSRLLGAALVTRHSPLYPPGLLDLELPPPALYVLGELPPEPAISIVGSRRADPYGIEVAETFSSELAARGLVVVSGLALGIDSAAHKGALAAGGKTVAVLGCGLDIDYPRSNRRLRREIAASAALVSEFPMGTPPEARNFPIRNRIIAALGCGTLVVRGTPRSGSLITAGCALTLGRQVWAVPGNIFDPRSMGPNSLIRDGAQPVQSAGELIETLPTPIGLRIEARARKLDGSGRQPDRSDLARVYRAVPAGATVDAGALREATGLALNQVLSCLVELEITGFLRRYPGPLWGRSGPGFTQREG